MAPCTTLAACATSFAAEICDERSRAASKAAAKTTRALLTSEATACSKRAKLGAEADARRCSKSVHDCASSDRVTELSEARVDAASWRSEQERLVGLILRGRAEADWTPGDPPSPCAAEWGGIVGDVGATPFSDTAASQLGNLTVPYLDALVASMILKCRRYGSQARKVGHVGSFPTHAVFTRWPV